MLELCSSSYFGAFYVNAKHQYIKQPIVWQATAYHRIQFSAMIVFKFQ